MAPDSSSALLDRLNAPFISKIEDEVGNPPVSRAHVLLAVSSLSIQLLLRKIVGCIPTDEEGTPVHNVPCWEF